MSESIFLLTYDPKFQSAFKSLNLQWIEQYFKVEEKDLKQVDHPEECLKNGGQIFFLRAKDEIVGTCALYKVSDGVYEIAKMAVKSESRGQGLGSRLMVAAEDWARSRQARKIIILSNTVLDPAIALYRKHGYETIHLGPHPDYERCNIVMEKSL